MLDGAIQRVKLQVQQTNGVAVSATLDLIAQRHTWQTGLDGERFSGVDAKVYHLSSDAQAIEFGITRAGAMELEVARLVEFSRVDSHRAVAQGQVLQVEHGVLCFCDGSLDSELFAFLLTSHYRENRDKE